MLQRFCSYFRAWNKRVLFYKKPLASELLSHHLRLRGLPHWTSFCIYKHQVVNDQFGLSFFNWKVDEVNYRILRTGCWPFLKYHCTKSPWVDLSAEDNFFTWLKFINLGFPTLTYGIGSWFLVRFSEDITINGVTVKVFFLIKERPFSKY